VHHSTPLPEAYNSGEGFIGWLLERLPTDCPLWLVEERERQKDVPEKLLEVLTPNQTESILGNK
jgi:hypothetical protein